MNFEIIMLNKANNTLELVIYTTSDILPLYFSAKNKLFAVHVPVNIKPVIKKTKYKENIEITYICKIKLNIFNAINKRIPVLIPNIAK